MAMAAEMIAIAVAKKAVITTLGYVGKLIEYEWCLKDSVKEGLRSLKNELEYMQACIGAVPCGPQDRINPVDKIWLTNVKELASAIDTGLQSFVSRIEPTKGKGKGDLAAATRHINRDIDSFIKEKMAKAKEVSEQRGRYGFGSSQTTTSAQKVDPRLVALFRKEPELVGLEEATNKLIQMLSSREHAHVSIVGMGGMGKTTLARVVHGKLAMSGNFDYAAFVPVGQQANVDKVLMDILEDLHIDICYRKPDTRQLMKQLQDSLKGKRCLFVFDDIWEDQTWELIKCAFEGTLESRIITTTRKVEVAKPFDGVYMIKPLSPASSKELLHTRLFGAEARTHHSEFSSLFDKILGKCGGVPLAISMIAGLLVKKPSHEWSKVYDSIGFREHEDVKEDISTILSYSYYDLPRRLQECFLYLSLFPEGQWIEKNMLIWRWVAEGLVPDGLFWRGEEYFKELADRSMIQREVSPRDLGQGGCRVHKIMLDLIRRLCEEEKFCTVMRESTSKTSTIHRLAIHKTRVDENPVDVGEVLSFYASTCSGSSLPPLSQFKRVRVLDLEGCDLSDGNRKLKHLAKLRELAYVGLLGTPVAELPKEIGDLKLLQTLDVTGTGIKELPAFVEKLKKLRCLRAGKGTSMKGRVGELTSLEELWLHSADKSPDFAAELRKLTKLRVLVIHFDKMDQAMGNVLVESLSDLTKLQVLQIWSDDTEEKVYFSSWGDSVPAEELRQLLLFRVILPKDTPWIHSCVCADFLYKLLLQVETLEKEHLEILGKMPSLVSLYLHSEDGNQLWYTAREGEFKVLEYLYTNIELVCGDGGLPKIQELEVAGIRVGTDVGLSVNNMPLLEKASYHLDCKYCGPEEVRQAEAHLRQAGETHPNHPTVSIQRFNNLELEIYNQWLAANAHFRGAGREVQTSTNSLLHILENSPIADLTYKAAETFGVPPTLVVGDAGTGAASSPSSVSPVVKISTDGTKSHIVESMALDLGKQNAVISNMMDYCIKIPKIVAMMINAVRNADGSLPASHYTRVMQEIGPAIISQLKQMACALGSGAGFPSPAIMMMIVSSALSQAANCMSGTQDREDKIHEINEENFAACEEIASNAMRLAGKDAADARNTLEFLQSPEYIECVRSMRRNRGGPQFGFELKKALKLFISAFLSSMPQETDLPAESGEDAYVNLVGKLAAEPSAHYLESLTEVTADSVLSWLNTQDGAVFLSETAARCGISQVAFRKLLEKHVQKPEMIASLNSARRSRGCSGMDRLLMQQLMPDIIDHFIEQSMPLLSSMLGYTGGGGPANVSGMLPGSLSNLAVRADPTAELASMDAAARTSASVSSTGQPSSKPDNVGIEEGGTE